MVALPPAVIFFSFSAASALVSFLLLPPLAASLSFSLFSFSWIFSRFTFFLLRLSRFLSVDVFSVSPRISPALFFSFKRKMVIIRRAVQLVQKESERVRGGWQMYHLDFFWRQQRDVAGANWGHLLHHDGRQVGHHFDLRDVLQGGGKMNARNSSLSK